MHASKFDEAQQARPPHTAATKGKLQGALPWLLSPIELLSLDFWVQRRAQSLQFKRGPATGLEVLVEPAPSFLSRIVLQPGWLHSAVYVLLSSHGLAVLWVGSKAGALLMLLGKQPSSQGHLGWLKPHLVLASWPPA